MSITITSPNNKEFLSWERKVLLCKYSKERLEIHIQDTMQSFSVNASTALHILYHRFIGELMEFSFPAGNIQPDIEDKTQIQDYEALPRPRE